MARNTVRLTSHSMFNPNASDRYLPPVLADLLASGDPALEAITVRVTTAKLGGADVTDQRVLETCIAEGRADHAGQQLGGVA